MPGPRPLDPSHHPEGSSQQTLVAPPRRASAPLQPPASHQVPQTWGCLDNSTSTVLNAGGAGIATVQDAGFAQCEFQHIRKCLLHHDAMAIKLLAGQERLEALLRDSSLGREFTTSTASTGTCLPQQKRSKWNCKAAGVAETPVSQGTPTPPASAQSAPTPRKMQALGGGMLSYSMALPRQVTHERPSSVLQRLSPRLQNLKVVNSHRQHDSKIEANMPRPPLHKPLDVDVYGAADREPKEKTLAKVTPSTTSGVNELSEVDFQAEDDGPLNFQNTSLSNPAKDRYSTVTMPEEKQPDGVIHEPKEVYEVSKTRSLRATVLSRGMLGDQNENPSDWNANKHWRNMIRKEKVKQERKMYKGSSILAREDDEEETRMVACIKGPVYENIGIALVVINALFIGYQVEYRANTGDFPSIRMPIEIAFAVFFLSEFLGKAYAWGCYGLFRGNVDIYWNMFDLFVVSFMWLEIAMELEVIPASEFGSVSILRILRILRLVRVVKVMRTLKFFRELRLMIMAISKGSFCLFWVIGVLFSAFYIFGVGITQGANDLCPGVNHEEGSDLGKLCDKFGTLPRSIISLYAAMSGGISWIELYIALGPLGGLYISIFLFYTIFSIFAVANIITGIFVESAMQSSKTDHESMIEAEMQKREEYVQSIHKVFMELDKDKSSKIDRTEFEQVVEKEKMIHYFNALGLEITDIKSLFALIDRDGTGEIDIEEFLVGCLRLKGEAKSLDLAKLSFQVEQVLHMLLNISDTVQCSNGGVFGDQNGHPRPVTSTVTSVSD